MWLLESNCKHQLRSRKRPPVGYTHQEYLWPRQELSFTSGKPLSAAAEDQVRLTSVPQTPDTPPQCPSPTKPGQVFAVNSCRAPVHLLPSCSCEFSEIKAQGLFAQHSAEHLKFSAWEGGWSKVKALYCWEAWTQQDTTKVLPDRPPSSLWAAGSCEVRDTPPSPSQTQESDRKSARILLGGHSERIWTIYTDCEMETGGFSHHPKVDLQIEMRP